jgi:DNA-binding transcriptional ArsR family regulator
MTDLPHEVTDVAALRALAHPMRQRILRHLHETGPATSTTLAHDLGGNSGIMSYHLRLLAEHGFVDEVPERAHGRERWWQASPGPVWIGREKLSEEARAEAFGLQLPSRADGLEDFEQFRAARESLGEWGRGTWAHLQATLSLTLDEARELVAEQQRLIARYRRDPSEVPPDARTVVVDILAHPRPPPRDHDHRRRRGPGAEDS